MAHRTSRRRRTRRSSRRRGTRRNSRRRSTRRNPRYVVANRRRSRRRKSRRPRRNSRKRSSKMRGNRRRVRRNQMDLIGSVVMPVAFGTAGFVAARYLGNMWAMKDWISSDPKVAKTAAAAVGIPAVFLAGRYAPTLARHSGPLVLGMGLAAAEAWLRDTPLLGGSPAAALVTNGNGNGGGNGNGMQPLPGTAPLVDQPGEMTVVENGGDGMSAYYPEPMAGMGDDYYTAGMLGNADPANQASVESALDRMENNGGDVAVSTIIPTDLALRAPTMPQWAPVREPFASQGDKGYAGGMFARHLFSGMMGS